MVLLKIKQGEHHLFNYECSIADSIDETTSKIVKIFNQRLKLQRICDEITCLAKHGVQIKPEMMGLTPDQIVELKHHDEYADSCVPSSGFDTECKDEVGRRCGRPPRTDMKNILVKTVNEARASVKNPDKKLTLENIDDQISNLRGAIMIVYPMNLPPYDHIRLEFEGKEEESLSGTQASKEIITDGGSLWFAGKLLQTEMSKKLSDFLGNNDRSRVIIKIQKRSSQQAPAKEPPMTKEEHQQMMLKMYRRQEEMKRLHEEAEFDQDSYLDSHWADSKQLAKQFQGLSTIKGFK